MVILTGIVACGRPFSIPGYRRLGRLGQASGTTASPMVGAKHRRTRKANHATLPLPCHAVRLAASGLPEEIRYISSYSCQWLRRLAVSSPASPAADPPRLAQLAPLAPLARLARLIDNACALACLLAFTSALTLPSGYNVGAVHATADRPRKLLRLSPVLPLCPSTCTRQYCDACHRRWHDRSCRGIYDRLTGNPIRLSVFVTPLLRLLFFCVPRGICRSPLYAGVTLESHSSCALGAHSKKMRKQESESVCKTPGSTNHWLACILTTRRTEALDSSDSSVGHGQQYANTHYDPDLAHPVHEVDDLYVECPSSTTERKLIYKIDLRVVPFLSIMYLLAFLDRYGRACFGLERGRANVDNYIARTSPMLPSSASRKT